MCEIILILQKNIQNIFIITVFQKIKKKIYIYE